MSLLLLTINKLSSFLAESARVLALRMADIDSRDGDLFGGVRMLTGGDAKSRIRGCMIFCIEGSNSLEVVSIAMAVGTPP